MRRADEAQSNQIKPARAENWPAGGKSGWRHTARSNPVKASQTRKGGLTQKKSLTIRGHANKHPNTLDIAALLLVDSPLFQQNALIKQHE